MAVAAKMNSAKMNIGVGMVSNLTPLWSLYNSDSTKITPQNLLRPLYDRAGEVGCGGAPWGPNGDVICRTHYSHTIQGL